MLMSPIAACRVCNRKSSITPSRPRVPPDTFGTDNEQRLDTCRGCFRPGGHSNRQRVVSQSVHDFMLSLVIRSSHIPNESPSTPPNTTDHQRERGKILIRMILQQTFISLKVDCRLLLERKKGNVGLQSWCGSMWPHRM